MSKSITQLRKWNLVAGGVDPRNDVIPASVGYGLEEGLQFAVSEITRLEERIKRMKEAGDAMMSEPCEYTFEQWIKSKEERL